MQGKGDRTLPNVLQVVAMPLIIGILTLRQVLSVCHDSLYVLLVIRNSKA